MYMYIYMGKAKTQAPDWGGILQIRLSSRNIRIMQSLEVLGGPMGSPGIPWGSQRASMGSPRGVTGLSMGVPERSQGSDGSPRMCFVGAFRVFASVKTSKNEHILTHY